MTATAAFISDSGTVLASLQGNNTSAGVAIATIPAASLPLGRYRVDIYTQLTAIANASRSHNVQLQANPTGAASRPLVQILQHIVAQNAAGFNPKSPLTIFVFLDGSTSLSANFIQNMAATETQDWTVQLVATRVSD